jgi:short-subunit dehydrogenase
MLGVYVTTKFAVVGMMEALRVELAGKNVGVSVFCPGLVKTNILDSERNRPAEYFNAGGPERSGPPPGIKGPSIDLMAVALDPLEVGRAVLAGIRNNNLYILTHGEFAQSVRERSEALLASFPRTPIPQARLDAVATYVPDIYAVEAARLKD